MPTFFDALDESFEVAKPKAPAAAKPAAPAAKKPEGGAAKPRGGGRGRGNDARGPRPQGGRGGPRGEGEGGAVQRDNRRRAPRDGPPRDGAPRRGREFDRHLSGTGRGKEMKKEGAGRHNWGSPTEGGEAPAENEEEKKPAEEGAAEEAAPEEEEDNDVTLDQLKAQQAEMREKLAAMIGGGMGERVVENKLKGKYVSAEKEVDPVAAKLDGRRIYEEKKTKYEDNAKYLGFRVDRPDQRPERRDGERRNFDGERRGGGRGGGRRDGPAAAGRGQGRGRGNQGGRRDDKAVDFTNKNAFPVLGQ